MRTAISKNNAEHYLWGEGCDGWHLVRSSDLSIIEEQMPSGTSEQRHYHEKAQQLFYVLSGELTLEVDGDSVVLHGGESYHVRPGTPHQALNKSTTGVCFLVVSQPPSHGDRQPAPA